MRTITITIATLLVTASTIWAQAPSEFNGDTSVTGQVQQLQGDLVRLQDEIRKAEVDVFEFRRLNGFPYVGYHAEENDRRLVQLMQTRSEIRATLWEMEVTHPELRADGVSTNVESTVLDQYRKLQKRHDAYEIAAYKWQAINWEKAPKMAELQRRQDRLDLLMRAHRDLARRLTSLEVEEVVATDISSVISNWTVEVP